MLIDIVVGAVALLLAWGLWFDRRRRTSGIADRRDRAMTEADAQSQAEVVARRTMSGGGVNGPGGFGGSSGI